MLRLKDGTILPQETITDRGIQYDYTCHIERDPETGKVIHQYLIERDGVQYTDAVDPLGSNRIYDETDIPVELEDEPETDSNSDYIEAAKILLGEDE